MQEIVDKRDLYGKAVLKNTHEWNILLSDNIVWEWDRWANLIS